MKISKRAITFLITLFTVAATLLPAQTAKKSETSSQYIVYVGTYTAKTASKGIYAFRYDANSGKLTPLGVAAETPDPSWVAVHPNGKYLYAANEAGKNSMISAFALDAKSGKLTLLNQVPALGEDPCYLSFDKTGEYLFAANYTSGNVVVFPIGADGKLGAATANVRDEGKLGPNKERQEAPHAHWVKQMWNDVFVADLGLDRILVYKFDPAKGALGPMPKPGPKNIRPQQPIEVSPGTGPRHVALSNKPNRNLIGFMYVLGELDSTVTVFGTTKEGDFEISWQKVPMLPDGFSARNDAAEIEIHPNGKFLYASNRGHDSIVVYSIDQDWGKLKQVADVPTGGKEPRHFAIDPSGNFLLAEDQLSDKIVTFRIDQKTGALTPTGDSVEVPSPVCLVFLPLD